MLAESTLNVGGRSFAPPVVDLAASAGAFLCAPHAFMVAMPPVDNELESGLVVPDKTARRRKLSVGTVICAGSHTGLTPGDWALVDPQYAKIVQGLVSGAFAHHGDVWMFGISSPHIRSAHVIESWHTVLAVLGRQEGFVAKEFVREPYEEQKLPGGYRSLRGRYVADGRIRVKLLEKWEETPGGLVLPPRLHDRPDKARVEAASSTCRFVKAGDTVIYQRRGIDNLYPEGDKTAAYMPERAVFAVCREAAGGSFQESGVRPESDAADSPDGAL